MIKLKHFQKQKVSHLTEKVKNLLDSFTQSEKDSMKTVLFEAPTGAGKTVMLANFIKDLFALFDNENESAKGLSFIWLTPGKGSLHIQSKEKITQELLYADVNVVYFEDIRNQTHFPNKTVAILNWEKISKKDNKLTQANEVFDLKHFLQKTRAKTNLIALVDEEHYAKTKKTDHVIQLFNPQIVVRTSATPATVEADDFVKIHRQSVVDAKLIRKEYILNQDIKEEVVESRLGPDFLLLKAAIQKRTILHDLFRKENSPVNPLIIIQLPDEKTELETEIKKEVIKYLTQQEPAITTKNGLLAIHLDREKENLNHLKQNDAKPIVIITKQAITQGWDCPRAQILVKLRHNSEKRFNIQTLGRICRVPEPDKGGYYQNDRLNFGYVYTFDKRLLTISDQPNDNSLTMKRELILNLKPEWKESVASFNLVNQVFVPLSDLNRSIKDANYVVFAKKFNHWLRKKQDLLNYQAGAQPIKHFLQSLAPITESKIFSSYEEGSIAGNWHRKDTIEKRITFTYRGQGLDFLRIRFDKTFASFLAKNLQNKNGDFIRQVFEYLFTKNNFNRIDLEKSEQDYLFDFGIWNTSSASSSDREQKEAYFYCFLINSKDKWLEWLKLFYKSVFDEEVQTVNSQLLSDKYRDYFQFPETKRYTFQVLENLVETDLERLPQPNNNLYQDFVKPYRPHFSNSEAELINFMEGYAFGRQIDWWYRNVENEKEAWKIIYLDKDGYPRNFYPDFIVQIKGQIWIIETKDSSGLDTNSQNKFNYLASFCQKYDLNFAFVVLTLQKRLKFNNSKWNYDFNSADWKVLDLLFSQTS